MCIRDRFKLAANEAIVVYGEKGVRTAAAEARLAPKEGAAAAAAAAKDVVLRVEPQVEGAAQVERRIVSGPAIFIPAASE